MRTSKFSFWLIAVLTFAICNQSAAQKAKIHLEDVDNFWAAYDSLQKVKEPALQQKIIQELYLDKGTNGLVQFVRIRKWNAIKYQQSIILHPLFWKSVRKNTLEVSKDVPQLQSLIKNYIKLYPEFKVPSIYFCISPIGTGGTTTQENVLIGTEISAGDSTVNTTGLNPFIQMVFKTNPSVISLVAHELTHTQQKGGDMEDRRSSDLLAFCLAEGAADFMSELISGEKVTRPYMYYGRAHQKEIWEAFRLQMNGKDAADWLYNGAIKRNGDADLGYFVGYMICKAYYIHTKNKRQAIRNIINLDLDDSQAAVNFLKNSGYSGR